MAKSHKERSRKAPIETMTSKEVEDIGMSLGSKIGEIGDKAAEEINRFAKVFGIKAKVAIQLYDEKTGQILS